MTRIQEFIHPVSFQYESASQWHENGLPLQLSYMSSFVNVSAELYHAIHMNTIDKEESSHQDISKWNVSSVSDMRYMFNSSSSFNQDISET